MREATRAGMIAGLVGGAPSTAHALITGGDPLAASLAAGTLLLRHETRRGRLLVAAAAAHVGLSLGWAHVLAAILPRRRAIPVAAAAGLAIAGFDLGVVGRRLPRIRALPVLPQLADHVAFAVTVAAVVRRPYRRVSGTT